MGWREEKPTQRQVDCIKGMLEFSEYENGYRQGKFEATQWIPVSDHLPEKNGEYLVTVGKDSRFAFNGEATVYEDTFYSLCQWDDCGNDVIAWMEMPEPYTEEEQ